MDFYRSADEISKFKNIIISVAGTNNTHCTYITTIIKNKYNKGYMRF